MARKQKEFEEYILQTGNSHVSQKEYSISPATAFLNYTVDTKDAMIACIKTFKKQNGAKKYTDPAIHSLQLITSALLPAIMGHFEMYQKYLFAGIFELTTYFESFDVKDFFKNLKKNATQVDIDITRLASYRGLDAPVGLVIADSLPSWHDPNKVNKYFILFGGKQQFYSNDNIDKLSILWQLRHSIVHTAGTLTIPDSHKLTVLKDFGGKNIVMDYNFIREVSRKLHPLVYDSTKRLETNFKSRLKSSLQEDDTKKVDKLFEVSSKIPSWLSILSTK